MLLGLWVLSSNAHVRLLLSSLVLVLFLWCVVHKGWHTATPPLELSFEMSVVDLDRERHELVDGFWSFDSNEVVLDV